MLEPYYSEDNGNIQIYCGDCLEILPQLQKSDLILTDTPYAGAGMKYDCYDDTDIKKTNDLIWEFLKLAIQNSKITIFPSGKYITEVMLYQKLPPKWRLCWHKGAGSNISPIGFNDWEMMMVYGDKVCVNQHDHFTVINNEKLGNHGHPCPKPIGWAKWIIHRFSLIGGVVIDPFLGSGTVAIACKELNRRCIGIEISEKYCEIAVRRLKNTIKPMF